MKKIILYIVILISSNFYSQVASVVPTLGLVGSFPFNGTCLNAITNNTCIVNGATLTKDRFGVNNKAYNLYGKNQSITIPSYNYNTLNNNFTVSFWFKTLSQLTMYVFNINDSNQYVSNFNFDMNDGVSGMWTFWNSGGTNALSSGAYTEYSDGYWHNVTFVQKDSLFKLFFDGNLKSSVINNASININKTITLGDSIYPFYGDIDDILIYNRALNDSEIRNVVDANISAPKVLFRKTTDAYQVGTSAKFFWQKPINIDSLIIEYSINNSNNWQLISDSVNANDNFINWIIPNNPGSTFNLKITNKQNLQQFAISTPFLISNYQWQQVNGYNTFGARDGAGAYVFKDSLFLLGGWTDVDNVNYPEKTNSEVWVSADGANWTLKTVAQWERRHTFGNLVFNNKMWVVGGDQLQGHFQKDVWNSTDGVNWTQVANNVPWGDRMTHITCVFNNKMWVMGGQKILGWGNTIDTVYNDVWSSSDGINWNLVTQAAPWQPRGQIGGSCVFNNKMWIIGGGTYNGNRIYYNDVWNTSDGVNWTQVSANTPWDKREYHEVIVYNNAMWVLGGFDATDNKRDVWYSTDGVNWTELVNTPWPVRHASSVFNYKQSLWIVAGNLWNDSWKLNTLVCPAINNQPQNQSGVVSGTASFTTSLNNINDQYQWQKFSNGVWTNLNPGPKYNGVNSCTFSVNNLNMTDNNNLFRSIVISGACTDTSNSVILSVLIPTGLADIDSGYTVNMFPNPVKDKLNIHLNEFNANSSITLTIIDIQGKILKKEYLNGNVHSTDLTDLTNGIYFLEILGEKGKSVRKFIKL